MCWGLQTLRRSTGPQPPGSCLRHQSCWSCRCSRPAHMGKAPGAAVDSRLLRSPSPLCSRPPLPPAAQACRAIRHPGFPPPPSDNHPRGWPCRPGHFHPLPLHPEPPATLAGQRHSPRGMADRPSSIHHSTSGGMMAHTGRSWGPDCRSCRWWAAVRLMGQACSKGVMSALPAGSAKSVWSALCHSTVPHMCCVVWVWYTVVECSAACAGSLRALACGLPAVSSAAGACTRVESRNATD